GKIKLRGKFEVELGKRKADKDKLIISEIPYTMIGVGINKFLVDVADLVESKKLTDVVDISNQSNKDMVQFAYDSLHTFNYLFVADFHKHTLSVYDPAEFM
ncbi:hypothetical protein NE476_30815, partial [Enterocloster bolteae]|nr:hypothetical protein [Enterocloster bolteae]